MPRGGWAWPTCCRPCATPQVVAQCAGGRCRRAHRRCDGGRQERRHARCALSGQGTVTALSDGRYEETGPTHGGFRFFNDGPSCALRTDDGYTLVLTSRSAGSSEPAAVPLPGHRADAIKIIVAKGVHSPRPAMEPIAKELIWVATRA
jgi:microcystin degradation protein MlrC